MTGRLAYFEWCADPDAEHDDRDAWAQANPSLGAHRENESGLTEEAIETEMGTLDPVDFARERLGIFPEDIDAVDPAIDPDDWQACAIHKSAAPPLPNPVLAFEVSVDRRWACIAAAGPMDSSTYVEVIENRERTGWVVPRLLELQASQKPSAILCNPAGPAGGLLPDCTKAGLVIGMVDPATGKVRAVSGRDYAQACAAATDAVTEHTWRHINQPELNMAVTGAGKRPVGDAFVFDRRGTVDISPLLAVTLAAWAVGLAKQQAEPTPGFFSMAELLDDH